MELKIGIDCGKRASLFGGTRVQLFCVICCGTQVKLLFCGARVISFVELVLTPRNTIFLLLGSTISFFCGTHAQSFVE